MADRKVKVAFVGLGHNGRAHVRAHLAVGKSEVVALCDRNEALLRKAGEEFGVRKLCAGDEIYSDPDIEAVSINTGDNQHKGPFLKAIAAGKHVLVEKPLANSEPDVAEMVAADDRADRRLKIQVAYVLRFNPVFAAIHRLARDGRLGRIYYMEGDYVHNLLYQAQQTDPVTGKNWYLDHELPMVGGGSHPLDILRWVSGKNVVGVWTYANHVAFPAMRNDDCQVSLYQFEDGTIAKVAALYAPRCGMAPYYNLRIYGTNGTVERDTVAISASEADHHPAFAPVDAQRTSGHPYEPEVRDWLEAILEDRPTRIGLHDGANSTIAALCAVRASQEGRQIEVPVFARRD